jgi:hypothetical protein
MRLKLLRLRLKKRKKTIRTRRRSNSFYPLKEKSPDHSVWAFFVTLWGLGSAQRDMPDSNTSYSEYLLSASHRSSFSSAGLYQPTIRTYVD